MRMKRAPIGLVVAPFAASGVAAYVPPKFGANKDGSVFGFGPF